MDEEDFTKLSLEDACAHKVWKARIIGYESTIKQFEQIEDEKSAEWNKYAGLMKKFVIDSHALCQEKGLEAVLIFVENCGVAGRTTSDVVSGIIQKCLAAPKARTKELGAQVILMYIEIEKYEIVVEELLKGTESKNPKVTAACVHVLTQALKEFGPKVISVSKLLKRVPPLLEDRDKVVRQETRMLVVEIYHWLGQSIKPQLSSVLKPNQLTEVEAEYEKVKDTPARPTRLLRSQQVKKSAAPGFDNADSGGGGDTADGEGAVEETDPFEFLEPVDILSQLNKEFYPKLESKKWVERKDVLEELDKLLQASPKLENADYGDLLRALKKVIQKDSNVVVVTFAVKCVTGIASGLKKKFHQYASFIMPVLFEKFKEKKQSVVTALREAVDAVYLTTSLDLLQEDILACLDNKNPSIKSETSEFLARCFCKATPSILNKKLLKPLCKGLSNGLRDQDPNVRNNAALAIGTAMKVVGEKAIGPFLVDIEAHSMKKVKEFYDKAEIVAKPVPTVSTNKAEKRPDCAEKADVKPKVVNKSKPVKPLPASSQPSNQVKLLSREAALNVARNIIPKEVYDGLLADDVENQVAACEKLSEIFNTIPVNDESGQALLALFSLHDFTIPGEKLILRMELVKRIAEKYPIPREGMELILHDISNHFSDSSCKNLVGEILTAFAKRTSLTAVARTILGTDDFSCNESEEQANLWAEKLNWISSGIMSIETIDDPAFLFDLGRKASIHSNTNVRNAGLALIGTVHLKGDNVVTRVVPDKTAPESINPVKSENSSVSRAESEVNIVKVPEKAVEQPKVDIGSKITENLLSELADKNWKVRAEAVVKLQSIINSSQSITGHLGDAAPLIASRIQDSNAKICGSAIALVESLAPAMGPSCKRYIPVFLPALMKAIGDQKIWIRSAVIPCLNTWGDVIGYEKFFEGELIADALKSGSPAVRAELWSWLSAKLPDIPPKSFPKEELVACLTVLYSNFEDRNAEVRKNACEAAYGFMLHLGYNNMVQAVDNIKGSGSSARVIKELLDKTRGNLPIVPLQKSKSISSSNEKPTGRTSSVKSLPGAAAASMKSKSSKTSISSSRSVQSFRGKREEEDYSPLLQINNLKHQRVIDEQKLKILKWTFVTPRAEFIELLKDLMYSANVNKALIANMFHLDFRYHLRAIENLAEDLPVNKEAMKCNLDLILRWMTLRFFDTNPSVLMKGLEYLNSVFTILIEDEYAMLDSEANGFIPYLIIKAGDPKDTVRNSVRVLLKQIASIYPSSKQFFFLTDGVKSKNARQRSECLDQMAWLIESYGVSVCHPSAPVAIREIAKHIGDRDHTVRNAALNCVVTAYFLEGEKVMKMIDKMSEKDSFLLEERIKRAAKNRPLNVVKPLVNVEVVKPMIVENSEAPESRGSPTRNNNDLSVEPSPEQSDETVNESMIPHSMPTTVSPRIRPSSGAYGFDRAVVDDIECVGSHFQAPKLVDIDLQFLKDSSHQSSFKPIQMPRMTPTISNYSQPNAIKRELVNIASSDIDKAMSAIARIDTIILSDKRNHLVEFADQLVSQLVHLIIILNQSAHPEVVNCYNATFSLFIKLCNSKDLCSQISEATLHKILEQFLLLLTEPRLDNKQNMFGRVVNNLIIRFLEQSNKTNVMCALFKILYSCVSNPKATNHFKDLVVKCLWKLNKAQPEWDSELDYVRVLSEFNLFLKDYPTSWWKNEEFDFPLRTVKTVLHSMVKIRGTEVRDIADRMPNVSKDSELYTYIKKVIKHLKVEEMQRENNTRERETHTHRESHATRESHTPRENHGPRETFTPVDGHVSREGQGITPKEFQASPHRLTKEEQDELSGIFRMIGDVDETKQGMRRLFAFIKTHPEANVEPFLSKTNPQFQHYIKKGLQALEEKKFESQDISRKDTTTSTEVPIVKDQENLTQEAEVLWTKLKTLQEQSGCQIEKNKEEISDRIKELPSGVIENPPDTEHTDLESLKKRIEKIKSGSHS